MSNPEGLSCVRCQVLLKEIKIKNEIIKELEDVVLDLKEQIDAYEWAMGI